MLRIAVTVASALFLVALTFSLQAAPQCQETPQPQEHQNSTQIGPGPSAVLTAAPSAQVSQPAAHQQTQNANGNLNHDWFDWYAAFGPPTWSNWILAAFAVVAAVIGLRTLSRISDQTRAAVKSADAAKLSADIAAKSDRPVLVVEKFVPHNVGSAGRNNDRHTSVNFQIANCGKGPALGVELLGSIKVTGGLPTPPDISDCHKMPLRNRVIEASKDIAAFVVYAPTKGPAILVSNDDMSLVEVSGLQLFAYGHITYRDIHRNQYRTIFSAQYLPARFSGPERFFPSPDEYNGHIDDGPDQGTGPPEPE
jgi:hypothetical protein